MEHIIYWKKSLEKGNIHGYAGAVFVGTIHTCSDGKHRSYVGDYYLRPGFSGYASDPIDRYPTISTAKKAIQKVTAEWFADCARVNNTLRWSYFDGWETKGYCANKHLGSVYAFKDGYHVDIFVPDGKVERTHKTLDAAKEALATGLAKWFDAAKEENI